MDTKEIKVGMLLPRSSLYPMLGADLASGFKAGLKELGLASVRLVYENIGFGALEDEVYAKAEKLLMQEEVSMVIAYIDHTAASRLDVLFQGYNRLLLVLDPGAHVPLDWTISPFRFTISLQSALSSRLTGYFAAKEGALRSVFATSYYEAGYLHCYSYQRGLEKGGGKTQYHFVVPFRLEQFTIDPLKEALLQLKPDAVLAQFSAEAGGIFLEGFVKAGLHEQVKLYVSPFMLEETWLSAQSFPFDGISGTVTWSRNLSHEMNRTFLDRIKAQSGREGNIFSMLGWEAAQFTLQALDILEKCEGNVQKAGNEFKTINFSSPRGLLKVHSATHCMFGPMYRVEIGKDEVTGNCALTPPEEIQDLLDDVEQFISDCPQGIFSKWTNTYLCI